MRPITSANLTSPCRLSEPHPSTVTVLLVTVAPAQQELHLSIPHNSINFVAILDALSMCAQDYME